MLVKITIVSLIEIIEYLISIATFHIIAILCIGVCGLFEGCV